MIRHRTQLDLEWIQDTLSELPGKMRTEFVQRFRPRLEAEVRSVATHVRAIDLAFGRAVASIEDTLIASEGTPVLRPGLQVKYVAAQLAHFLTMFLDFIIGYVISVQGFHLAWGWALGVALLFAGLAVLSRAVASLWLDRNRLGQYVWLFLRLGLAGWVIVVFCFLGLYAVRNALVGIGWLALLTPLLWLACLSQSLAFGALAEVFGFPAALVRRHRELTARLAELESVRNLMLTGGPPDIEDGHGSIPRLRGAPRGGSDRARSHVRRRRRAARVVGLLALVTSLVGFFHPASARPNAITRLVIALDESPGTEDTDEYPRVRRVLAQGIADILDPLSQVVTVQVIHWDEATSVWAVGPSFELPSTSRPAPLMEAGLEVFGYAASLADSRERAREKTLRKPILDRIGRAILTRPPARSTSSCVSQMLTRAEEAPPSDAWVVVSDLADYRCAIPVSCVPGGAAVVVVVVPRREGALTRTRLEERKARMRGLFPDVRFVDSWDVDGSSTLRETFSCFGSDVIRRMSR